MVSPRLVTTIRLARAYGSGRLRFISASPREQLGEHLDERVALACRVADEGGGAEAATLEVGHERADGIGVTADDHHDRVGVGQRASSMTSDIANCPYLPW